MKLPREVKIRIHPDGRVEIETFGFVGASCTELSAFLEQALAGEPDGGEKIERDLKPEYYLAEQDLKQDLEERGR